MTDLETVISDLRRLSDDLYADGRYSDSKICQEAVTLLKAQEPVKPIIINGEPECGACRYELRPDMDSYCPCCGKAVKWDG